MARFTSRKFVLTLICIAISAGALLLGKLSGQEWVYLVLGILAFHHTANVISKQVTTTTDTQ